MAAVNPLSGPRVFNRNFLAHPILSLLVHVNDTNRTQ
jgi:hypothetical protein